MWTVYWFIRDACWFIFWIFVAYSMLVTVAAMEAVYKACDVDKMTTMECMVSLAMRYDVWHLKVMFDYNPGIYLIVVLNATFDGLRTLLLYANTI
jgi:hypothetical protein